MEAHLTARRDQLANLCRQHGVVRLEVFGSAVDGTFDAQRSDYDFIASFTDDPALPMARRFLGFNEALEQLLGRSDDLMTDHPISNPYLRAAVNATRTMIHDESPAETSV